MKISIVFPLSIVSVAATGLSSSRSWDYVSIEQTTKLLQQIEFVGRAVHQARLKSSQDDIGEACLNGTETVNEDSSYQDALIQLENCPVSADYSTSTITVDYSSCEPNNGNVQLACTAAGGQISVIPEITVNCYSMGVTIKTEVLNMPACAGKDCPGDITANGEFKGIIEAEMAKVLEAELRNQLRNRGYAVTCSGSGSDGGSPSASSKVSTSLAVGALVLGALAL